MKWRIVLVPFAFLVVWFSRAVERWVMIRFGEVWSSRLGHLIGNTECYLCEKPPHTFDIFTFQKPSANKVIENKYRKILHTWPRYFGSLVVTINRFYRRWEFHEAKSLQFDRDIYNLWKKPHIGLTQEEKDEGRELLRNLGIPQTARWVCLIVRDSEYLKERGDFSYHDYRDADIDDYMQAAKALADRGRYIIRMGSRVAKPLSIKHPKIIDYASSKFRSELGDLYLGANCEFCLGTSTGFMAIPQIFKRPCAVTDFVPIEYISTFCKDRVIWKHHFKDREEMTFEEIIESGAGQFLQSKGFKANGITLRNNTPEEITELALEMLTNQREDQTQFWEKFPKSTDVYDGKPLHGQILCRIGSAFLARVQDHSKARHQGTESRKAASV